MRNRLFDTPTFFEREVHDHEVLLSFIHDEDADLFRDWLSDRGEDLFARYRDNVISNRDWGIEDDN